MKDQVRYGGLIQTETGGPPSTPTHPTFLLSVKHGSSVEEEKAGLEAGALHQLRPYVAAGGEGGAGLMYKDVPQ